MKLFDRETHAREAVVAELMSESVHAQEVLQLKGRLYKKGKFEERDQELAIEEEEPCLNGGSSIATPYQ